MRILNFFLEVIFINQFLHSLQLISTGVHAAGGQKCSFMYPVERDLFGNSRPCLIPCKRANRKCIICSKKNGRRRGICLAVHKKRYVFKCKICMNPHDLTENQIKRINSLNDLKLGSK